MTETRNLDEVAVACPRGGHVLAVVVFDDGCSLHLTDRDRTADRADDVKAGPPRGNTFMDLQRVRHDLVGRSRDPVVPDGLPGWGRAAQSAHPRDPHEAVRFTCRRCATATRDEFGRATGRRVPSYSIRWPVLRSAAEDARAQGLDLVRVYGDGTTSIGRHVASRTSQGVALWKP